MCETQYFPVASFSSGDFGPYALDGGDDGFVET